MKRGQRHNNTSATQWLHQSLAAGIISKSTWTSKQTDDMASFIEWVTQEALHGLIRLSAAVCGGWGVSIVCKKLQFHDSNWDVSSSKKVTDIFKWFANSSTGLGEEKTKRKQRVNPVKTHVHTVLSWSTSFLDQKQATLLPHSMCFVCVAWGSPGLCVSLLFSDWDTPHRSPSTFMTWTKFTYL